MVQGRLCVQPQVGPLLFFEGCEEDYSTVLFVLRLKRVSKTVEHDLLVRRLFSFLQACQEYLFFVFRTS